MSNIKAKTVQNQGEENSSYAKHKKIYSKEAKGRFATLRIWAVFALLGLFYGIPWLQWDGRQAVLFDLPARKFYIFGMTLWPQDFIFLAFLLIIAGMALFFFTTLAGRLWCGYACPQTVWTEVFIWIERWVEGDRNSQMKLDKAPMSANKFRKKFTKHTAWILFSAFTGFIFVAYFTPLTDLARNVASFELGPWESFWIFFYGLATYGNAGWLREQVCLHMCPYARFQSVMFDKDTLIVAYDEERGDPRGGRKKNADYQADGLGSCIDCKLCVQVCPTGIDIRDGLQYECIGCSACIDVCDDVMERMNYDKGLIKYTTENSAEGQETKLFRPRIIVYGLVLLGMASVLVYSMAARVPLNLDILRDRNAIFRETSEGLIENVYTLQLANMEEQAHQFQLSVEGIDGLEMELAQEEIVVAAGELISFPVRLKIDEVDLEDRSTPIYFTLQSKDKESLKIEAETRFIGPRK